MCAAAPPPPRSSLYVHIPFCVRRCDYCDFASSVHDARLAARYLAALAAEAGRVLPRGFAPETVYIGGGTPTALGRDGLTQLFEILCEACDLSSVREMTVEANPGTLDRERARLLRAAGVTRMSLGVQSLRARELALLGRAHSAEEARAAFRLLREEGFGNVSVDLIYGLPGGRPDELTASLEGVLAFTPEHVSCYALSLEPGTRLAARVNAGELPRPEEELVREMYFLAVDRLAGAGLARYELSNFASPSFECLHNRGCWTGRPYVGLGPSAASFDGEERRMNERDVETYVAVVEAGREATTERERLAPEQRAREALMLRLRMAAGVDLAAFRRETGFDAEALAGRAFARFGALGLLRWESGRIALARDGLPVADSILAEVI